MRMMWRSASTGCLIQIIRGIGYPQAADFRMRKRCSCRNGSNQLTSWTDDRALFAERTGGDFSADIDDGFCVDLLKRICGSVIQGQTHSGHEYQTRRHRPVHAARLSEGCADPLRCESALLGRTPEGGAAALCDYA